MSMKILKMFLLAAIIIFAGTLSLLAQTQILTLSTTNGSGGSPQFVRAAVTPNQIVTFLCFSGYTNNSLASCWITLTNGTQVYPFSLPGQSPGSGMFNTGQLTLTGATNITVEAYQGAAATFSITSSSSTISNYVPANAVVIPSDVSGPVQIILESSSDLVNWNAAMPGTYGNTYSNRFFRVRAAVGQ